MLDIRFIRENVEAVQENARNKGYEVDVAALINLDNQRRDLQLKVDELREKRNSISAQMKGGKPDVNLVAQGKSIKESLIILESQLKNVENDYVSAIKKIPNMSLPSVPIGSSENENVVEKTVGDLPKFEFEPKNHAQIAESRDWIDKIRAAKVAGSRFAYIKRELVKLQFAIIQYTIDTLTDEEKIKEIAKSANLDVNTRPFIAVLPPFMLKTDMYDAMDRLEPREERYKIDGDELWVQGSAEHVLGSMHANEVLSEDDLPLRYLGYATSFRREAGTYGKDMEGIIRMHQFDKLEIESLTTANDGPNEHNLFIAIQEYLLSQLGLPYRVIRKCTADIGKPNASGVDMDTWLPGQNNYRETHTADYMTDYQARRLNTRVKRASGDLELVHTNDATAFALGRIMIAIIENNQTEDEKVIIPNVLRPYMNGRDSI